MEKNRLYPSEDANDMIFRRFLKDKGWKIAYYSPPHGSWTIIEFDIDDVKYRGFSGRDRRRPDIIAYKIRNSTIFLLVCESKGRLDDITIKDMLDYRGRMEEYVNSLLSSEFKLRKEGLWNFYKKTIDLEDYDIKKSYFFLFGSKLDKFSENFDELKRRINKVEEENVFGVLATTNWDEMTSLVKIDGEEQLCEIETDKEIEVSY